MKILANKYGGECLSKKYFGVSNNIKWKCKNNHIFNKRPDNINTTGIFCSKCNGKNSWSINDCIKIAQQNGGRCLSKKYININKKMLWECGVGHRWYTSFYKIKNLSRWCHKCGGSERLTIDIFKDIAKNMGGICVSNSYVNIKQKLLFQCSEGHRWKTSGLSIKNQKSWCPVCSSGKTQKKLFNILTEIFPDKDIYNNYTEFDWLATRKGGKQEIDIYIPELKLAIEYDGEQHFRPVRFGGISYKRAKDKFKNVKYLDKLKNFKVSQNKNDIKYFIRFNYQEDISYKYVESKVRMVLGGEI